MSKDGHVTIDKAGIQTIHLSRVEGGAKSIPAKVTEKIDDAVERAKLEHKRKSEQ